MLTQKCIEMFDIKEKIGQGEYGEVFRAEHRETKINYAVKTVCLKNPKEGVPSSTIREVSILGSLKHPNIIRLYNLINYQQNLYLIFDLCDCDLRKYLNESKSLLTVFESKKIIFQILRAMKFLNDKHILHRDLKPQNILIIKSPHPDCSVFPNSPLIKIADFGLARASNIPAENYTAEVVTRWYRAPELLLGSTKYGEEIEMWSVGCIMVEILTKKVLFPGKDEVDQVKKVFNFFGLPSLEEWPECPSLPGYKNLLNQKLNSQRKDISDYFDDLDKEGLDLLEGLLKLNPKYRISVDDALHHRWFSDLPGQTAIDFK